MASNIEDLSAAVEVLQVAYDKARHELDVAGFPDMFTVVDTNGRYILLDAATALVNARSALANAERG
jgi:hypothetical protein